MTSSMSLARSCASALSVPAGVSLRGEPVEEGQNEQDDDQDADDHEDRREAAKSRSRLLERVLETTASSRSPAATITPTPKYRLRSWRRKNSRSSGSRSGSRDLLIEPLPEAEENGDQQDTDRCDPDLWRDVVDEQTYAKLPRIIGRIASVRRRHEDDGSGVHASARRSRIQRDSVESVDRERMVASMRRLSRTPAHARKIGAAAVPVQYSSSLVSCFSTESARRPISSIASRSSSGRTVSRRNVRDITNICLPSTS